MVILLVGFMGCGKSTIGRRLAKRLGCGFVDMDSSIEQQAGMSISEIFANKGEEAFRRMETEFLEGISSESDLIVATGGGAPCFGDNMKTMKSKGLVVYFRMRPEMLFRRLEKGREKRPKLAGMNDEKLITYIETALAQREPVYSQASVTIDCNGVSDEYIATHLEYIIKQGA